MVYEVKQRSSAEEGKELQRARGWVAFSTKRKEGALQIQTEGEDKYKFIQTQIEDTREGVLKEKILRAE